MAVRPLLMIPGPIEVSPEVIEAFSGPPPGHVSPPVIEAFGSSLEMMRDVWCADNAAQPFVVAGSGTTAMDMAAYNMIEPGEVALVINTGYFGDRAAEMLRRRGATVHEVVSELGQIPTADDIEAAITQHQPVLVWAPHVDTSTGARVDAKVVCEAANRHGVLTVFDGICATAAEEFRMADWGADVYLTASQKAIGLPPGLALVVVSERAMAKRSSLNVPPPMSLDFHQWLPIMTAYEERRPSYFATPATSLIMALSVALKQTLDHGMDATFARHQQVADAFRAAFHNMGLEMLAGPGVEANTLSAVKYPAGVDAAMTKEVAKRGAIIAGGLHPKLKTTYFRVGHMGYSAFQNDWLLRTLVAVQGGLEACGHKSDSSVLDKFQDAIA